MNPECRAGKHSNCDGKAWRDDLCDIGPCLCGCHETVAMPVVTMTEEGPVGHCTCGCNDDPTRPAWKVEMTDEGPMVIPPAPEWAFGPEAVPPVFLDYGGTAAPTPADFEIPRCPNCDMPLDGPHDFRCPNRVGL